MTTFSYDGIVPIKQDMRGHIEWAFTSCDLNKFALSRTKGHCGAYLNFSVDENGGESVRYHFRVNDSVHMDIYIRRLSRFLAILGKEYARGAWTETYCRDDGRAVRSERVHDYAPIGVG